MFAKKTIANNWQRDFQAYVSACPGIITSSLKRAVSLYSSRCGDFEYKEHNSAFSLLVFLPTKPITPVEFPFKRSS